MHRDSKIAWDQMPNVSQHRHQNSRDLAEYTRVVVRDTRGSEVSQPCLLTTVRTLVY